MALSPTTLIDLGGAVSDLFAYEGNQYKKEGLELEEQNYEAASQLALQNEQFVKTSTNIKQQQSDRELYQSLGKTTVNVAGAGLDLSGSSLDILRESAQQGAATRAVIGQQGLIQEAGYAEEATSYENMAKAAQVSEQALSTSSMGDILAGGLKLAGALTTLLPGGNILSGLLSPSGGKGGDSA